LIVTLFISKPRDFEALIDELVIQEPLIAKPNSFVKKPLFIHVISWLTAIRLFVADVPGTVEP
jgi:hypothetical protein